jgi:hypothetical protein
MFFSAQRIGRSGLILWPVRASANLSDPSRFTECSLLKVLVSVVARRTTRSDCRVDNGLGGILATSADQISVGGRQAVDVHPTG